MTDLMRMPDENNVSWWCPGCQRRHGVPLKLAGDVYWEWNGSLEAPTLAPSVLVYGHQELIDSDLPWGEEEGQLLHPSNKRMTPRCHTFIRNGQIEFLGDCTHELAGQTVQMTEAPAKGV